MRPERSNNEPHHGQGHLHPPPLPPSRRSGPDPIAAGARPEPPRHHGAGTLKAHLPPADASRRAAEFAWLALFLCLAALLILPALRHPGERIAANLGHAGVQGELFHQWDFLEHARSGRLSTYYYSRNVSYPAGQDLRRYIGFSLHLFLYLPLIRISDPVIAYNLLVLLALALNGWCAFLLARHLTRSPWPSLLAGALFLLSPYALLKLEQGFLQKVMLWWIPLFALFLLRFTESRKKSDAALAGLFWALMLLSYAVYAWYALLFGTLLAAAALLRDRLAAADLARRGWPFLVPSLPAILFLALVLPAGGFDPELRPGGIPFAVAVAPAGGVDPLHPLRSFPYRGMIPQAAALPLGVSLLSLLLGGAALLRRRPRSGILALAALLFWVIAVGPFPHTGGQLLARFPLPYRLLAGYLPWGERLGFPLRALPFAEISLACLAALGVSPVAPAPGGGRRLTALAFAGLLVALAGERRLLAPETFPPVVSTAVLPAELAWLRREGGAVLHLPVDAGGGSPKEYGAVAARTGTPMLNAYTPARGGFTDPPLPDPEPKAMARYLEELAARGCRFILIHPRFLEPPPELPPGAHPARAYTLRDTLAFRAWCGPPVWNDPRRLVAYRVPDAARVERIRAAIADPGEAAVRDFLLLAEARRLGIPEPPLVPDQPPAEPKGALIEALLEKQVYPGARVAEAELPAWYGSRRGEFRRPDQIRVHHFLVPRPTAGGEAALSAARAEAERIRREVSGDASRSFALADELTRRDPAGLRWGDIGYFSRGTFPLVVDEVLFALRRVGETALLELPDGFHVFRLMDLRPGREYSFAEVREAVRERAGAEARARAVASFVEGLAARGGDLDVVYLPGGTFRMGSTPEEVDRAREMARRFAGRTREVRREWFEDEEYREVRVRPFLMDRHEVTVAQYRAFLRASGRRPPEGWMEGADGRLPVTGVSWHDARDYAAWVGKRLPTAEEWEWAARGAGRRLYPWGDEPPDGTRANYADRRSALPWNDPEHDDGHAGLAPAGSYPAGATPEGVLDLAGNAREWTDSRRRGIVDPSDNHIWDLAQRRAVPGGENLVPVEMRVVRGGSFDGAADDLRSSDMRILPPETRHGALGFRCAVNLP